MTRRRYAEDTSVPIGKSRHEIDGLLRDWGCHQIMWGDDYRQGRAVVRFVWEFEGTQYVARVTLKIPTDKELEAEAVHATTRAFLPAKFAKLAARRGWPEHRQLALWLRACFNAIEAGIIEPGQVFMPFLEDATGHTLGETLLPRLPQMLERGGARNLLPEQIES